MPNFTKMAIKVSFLKLLNQQPLSKISVRSIVEDCGINRNSFYYHFRDIPSLIEEIVSDSANDIIGKYPNIASAEECFNAAFSFALENKKAVLHIYNSVNRDIFETYFMNICEHVVTRYLDTVFGVGTVSDFDRRILIRFTKCELFGLCVDWMSSGMPDGSIEEIKHMLYLCRGLSDEIIRRCRESEK